MTRRSKAPKGHTLYWVYVNFTNGSYNFDTSPSLAGAREIMAEFRRERGVQDIYAFYGNAQGAFTEIDHVLSWRPR